ncbi:MAG: aminotransferase class IV [Alphaproteobacteria bacterium]|nr:aminotransferase class IV [Alphaproteobacteria bacterium]
MMTAPPAKKIWLNGEILAAHAARIAPDDRGFLLADGVFETALMQMGEVYWFADHLTRLRDGAALMGIDLPAILRPEQHSDVTQSLEQIWRVNGFPARAALRITLTRGVSQSRGIWPPSQPISPTLMMSLSPLAPARIAPITVKLAQTTRRNEYSPLSRIKSLGYGDAILARREAVAQGANDAVLLNCQGNLACSTAGNVFLRVHGEWLTPDLDSGILPGLARARLLPILSAKAAPLPARLWQNCDALLICNSLGLTPVKKIDQHELVALDAEFLDEIESTLYQV